MSRSFAFAIALLGSGWWSGMVSPVLASPRFGLQAGRQVAFHQMRQGPRNRCLPVRTRGLDHLHIRLAKKQADRDRDGLTNRFERLHSHTNPHRADTDHDGLSDRSEVLRYHTNPRRRDTDRDGLPDRLELRIGTSPRIWDSNCDGIRDTASIRGTVKQSSGTRPPVHSSPHERPSQPHAQGPKGGEQSEDPPPTTEPSPTPPKCPDPNAIWVSESGRDDGSGSVEQPVRTLGEGVSIADSTTAATICVSSGLYPSFTDTASHEPPLRIIGSGTTQPIVAGISLKGAQNLSIEKLTITGQVYLSAHPMLHLEQPPERIALIGSSVTTDLQEDCVVIRDAARQIELRDNHLFRCTRGVQGPGRVPPSSELTIVDNLMEHFIDDGIAFGEWSDVRIAHNTIRSIDEPDPTESAHTDGIQFYGNSSRITIVGNRIYQSRHQLLFLGDATGANHDISIENNLLYGAGAYAMQVGGSTGVSIINNTIWETHYGALILRAGAVSGVTATDTVVVDNVLDKYVEYEGASAATRRDNLIKWASTQAGPGDMIGVDPCFVDEAGNDYHPTSTSVLVGAGESSFAPADDLDGLLRPDPPTIGAFEPTSR